MKGRKTGGEEVSRGRKVQRYYAIPQVPKVGKESKARSGNEQEQEIK